MSHAAINLSEDSNNIIIKISGSIDEDIQLKNISVDATRPMLFVMDEVKMINSSGVREWITWCKQFDGDKWVFQGCPPIFINQLNMIEGFIPKKSKIKSFYVPYYSENTDEEKRVLIESADVKDGKFKDNAVLDSQGNRMELDIIPEKYLKFITRY